MTVILGISAFYHDSAASLIGDGVILAAAEEERFTRRKQDSSFPIHAIKSVIETAGLQPTDVDQVVFYEKPFLKFERLLETFVAYAPFGFRNFRAALPVWLNEKLFQKRLIIQELELIGIDAPLCFCEHHLSHAASAYYPSPFNKALVLTLDGVGEWTTTSLSIGQGHELDMKRVINFPHSLGLLYSAFTYYCGFRVNSGEYKLMGLAPYGEPRYRNLIVEHLVDVKPDGSFRLNQRYFNYATGLTMTNSRFHRLFGRPPRDADDSEIQEFYMDVAASVQQVLNEIVVALAKSALDDFPNRQLCLAGGVALNCVTNGELRRSGLFDDIWIQPASGDAGAAIGAALYYWHMEMANERKPIKRDGMSGSLLGPQFDDQQASRELDALDAVYIKLNDDSLFDEASKLLAHGKTIGWFQGRMEFGPRALGNRSIIADPRDPEMQRRLNLQIKKRESFRPFAPIVLEEDLETYFATTTPSPYMLFVEPVADQQRRHITRKIKGLDQLGQLRSDIPAVTHVDHSARIQTVDEEVNPRLHQLLSAFKKRTDCSVLVNTSFNVRGEPIVCSITDAYTCFMATDIDTLICGNFLMMKTDQPNRVRAEQSFHPD